VDDDQVDLPAPGAVDMRAFDEWVCHGSSSVEPQHIVTFDCMIPLGEAQCKLDLQRCGPAPLGVFAR
jgi:hypothetical protein